MAGLGSVPSDLRAHSCGCGRLVDDWRTGAGVAGLGGVHAIVVSVDHPRVDRLVAQHEDEEAVQDRQDKEPRECGDQALPELVAGPRGLASHVERCKARSR